MVLLLISMVSSNETKNQRVAMGLLQGGWIIKSIAIGDGIPTGIPSRAGLGVGFGGRADMIGEEEAPS